MTINTSHKNKEPSLKRKLKLAIATAYTLFLSIFLFRLTEYLISFDLNIILSINLPLLILAFATIPVWRRTGVSMTLCTLILISIWVLVSIGVFLTLIVLLSFIGSIESISMSITITLTLFYFAGYRPIVKWYEYENIKMRYKDE